MIRHAALLAALLLVLPGTAHATPDLLALTNADRATPLASDAYLTTKATGARDLDGRAGLLQSQHPPDGHLVFVEMRAEGYCFRMAGENIGMWNPEKDPKPSSGVHGEPGASSQHSEPRVDRHGLRLCVRERWAVVRRGAIRAAVRGAHSRGHPEPNC